MPICGEELGSAWGHVLLPGILGGDGVRGVTGVSQVGFLRWRDFFLVFAQNLDEKAFRLNKKLIGAQVGDIIWGTGHVSSNDRLHWSSLGDL